MMFLWLIIIGVLLYFLLRGNIQFDGLHKKNAMELLDERLARGEIDIEEYQKIKTTLKENKK